MKVLFIAPLYDRVNGMSLASEVFLEALKEKHTPVVVNIAKTPAAKKKTWGAFIRVKEVFQLVGEVFRKKRGVDAVYFTISESILGNLKDLLIFLACHDKLSRCVVHLHGGGVMRSLLSDQHPWLRKINLYFLNKVKTIIVLGETQTHIYAQVSDQNKIRIVPNFASDSIFVNSAQIQEKFNQVKPLKLLSVSNFLPGKGQFDLLEAFLRLPQSAQEAVELDFAGDMPSESDRALFFQKIQNFPQIRYHGIVKGDQKRKLFAEAHVFCMPTYYASEGQPIAILEAYAAGCAVIVTQHEGIVDIFDEGQSGFAVAKKSPDSIVQAIVTALAAREKLFVMAKYNLQAAQNKYTVGTYNSRLLSIIDEIAIESYGRCRGSKRG